MDCQSATTFIVSGNVPHPEPVQQADGPSDNIIYPNKMMATPVMGTGDAQMNNTMMPQNPYDPSQ